MRITSGIARGISLDAPKGDFTRPATDAARQAIFSSLGDAVEGAFVLDLFAGTGSYGLEAASRGAAEVTFIENDRRAFECLKRNIAAVSKSMSASDAKTRFFSLSADCTRPSAFEGKSFDIVFADPPYAMLFAPQSLSKIMSALCAAAAENTLIVLESPADFELPTETSDGKFAFRQIGRLGKKSKGKPSQIIFKIEKP